MQEQKSAQNQTHKNENFQAVKTILSSHSAVTLCSASFALAILSAIKGLSSTMYMSRLPELSFFYYFCGKSSVPIVNGIASVFVIIFCIYSFVSIFSVHKGIKTEQFDSALNALKNFRNSLIYLLTFSFLFLITALGSVSVMYQAYQSNNSEFAKIGGTSSQSLFMTSLLYGTVVIGLAISLLYVTDSVKKTIKGGTLAVISPMVSTVFFCFGGFVFLISFFSALDALVMTSSSVTGGRISFSFIANAACNVLIYAAATVICIAAAVICGRIYSRAADYSRRNPAKNYQYSVNVYPQQYNRRPYYDFSQNRQLQIYGNMPNQNQFWGRPPVNSGNSFPPPAMTDNNKNNFENKTAKSEEESEKTDDSIIQDKEE